MPNPGRIQLVVVAHDRLVERIGGRAIATHKRHSGAHALHPPQALGHERLTQTTPLVCGHGRNRLHIRTLGDVVEPHGAKRRDGTIGRNFASCSEVDAQAVGGGQDVPKPEFVAGFPAAKRELVRRKFEALVEKCRDVAKAVAERDAALGADGQIKTLNHAVDKVEREIVAYEEQKASARKLLENAIEEFQASGATAAASPRS